MATQNGVATFLPGSATQGVDLFTFPDNIDNFGPNQYVGRSLSVTQAGRLAIVALEQAIEQVSEQQGDPTLRG